MLVDGTLTIKTPRWAVPLLKPSRYKGAHGGRGSGKSHERAEALVERCIMERTFAVCIREVQKTLAQSVKKLIESKIESLGVGHLFDVQQAVIKAPHGGLIIFQGMQNHTADSIKSLEGYDIAWVEEAQSLSQRSLDLLRPTIRKPGSELWFTWNPSLPTDPIDVLLRGESPPPDAIVVQANYRDNPWLPDVLREELEYDRSRDPDKFAHIWLGEYQRNSEARVFKNWRIEECEPPTGVTFRFGSDFGFSVDPSCALRCWVGGRNLYVDYEAYRIGCEIDQLPDLFMSVPEIERWPMVADTSRPETISFLRRHGFPKIQPAIKGARSVEEGVSFLQSYDIIVHPRCVHLIDELTLYSFEVDDLTGAVLPKLADKDNHCIAEGQRVLCERGLVPIEQVTVADRVWTRAGWKRVLFADQTDADREVVEVIAGNHSVICTPDHELWVCGKGMVRADALSYGDDLLIEVSSQWQNLKPSSGMATVTGAILTAAAGATNAISVALAKASQRFSTGTFGSITMEQSPLAAISTTSTAIPATTTSTISNASKRANIWSSMAQTGPMSDESGRKHTSIASGHLQKCGTVQKRGVPNIARLARWLTKALSQFRSHAGIAATLSPRERWAALISIARTSASPQHEEQAALTMNSASAASVDRRSPSTDTAKPRLVRAPVQIVRAAGRSDRVYDLTVEDQHEFVAEGILVSNCIDALRYAMEGVRRAAAAKPAPKPVAAPIKRTAFNRR